MKKVYLIVSIMFLVSTGIILTACSRDDDSLDDPVLNEIDPSLLEQTTTEYSYSDFEAENLHIRTTATNGTWVINKLNGIVSEIYYGLQPSPEPPHGPEDFFKDNLPLSADDEMKRDGWYSGILMYRQFYKGIPVEQCTWNFRLNGDMMDWAFGRFAVINSLDVVPLISEDYAKRIVASYIKDSVEGEDKQFYLAVMEFPAETTWEPRLVYVYKHDPWERHNYVYVDAKTGRLLYQILFSGDKPYY